MSNALTVTEKEHWKNRISKRIDQRIEALSAEDPGFLVRVQEAARKQALKSLGIDKLHERRERIQKQRKSLDARDEATERSMLAAVRGVPVRDIRVSRYGTGEEIDSAVKKRQVPHEEQLLAKTKRGRDILRLRQEKDNLLDTVWLATSPKQIKDLWQQVDKMLGGEQTKLQRAALAIEPIDPA